MMPAIPPAMLALISKCLGYCCVAGACITKLPQLYNVVKSGSAEGLSPLSFELETAGLLVHTSYGYINGLAFSAYGDALVLWAQNLVLLLLIYQLQRVSAVRTALALGVITAYAAAAFTGRISQAHVQLAFAANNLVFISARVPQIYSNWASKNTGQLSIITGAINTGGCVVRIFTSITERAGAAMVRSYCISLVLNAIILLQMLIYRGAPPKAKAPAKAKPAAEKKKSK